MIAQMLFYFFFFFTFLFCFLFNMEEQIDNK